MNSSSPSASRPQGLPYRPLEVKTRLNVARHRAQVRSASLAYYALRTFLTLFGGLVPYQLLYLWQQNRATTPVEDSFYHERLERLRHRYNSELNTPR